MSLLSPRFGAIACLAFLLGGCATIRAAPPNIFNTASLVATARAYTPDSVGTALESKDEAAQQAYRNKVVLAYLNALDAQYYDFRNRLSMEGRSGGLLFDTLIQGTSTAGTVAPGVAPELSAATGFLSGTRAAISKNLLLDKTLPAIFASMDAARLRQKTVVLERMGSTIARYPMEMAWNDLQAYQLAGTFDDAVTQITDAAAGDRASARATYNRSMGLACDATADLVPLRYELGEIVHKIYTDAASPDRNTAARGQLRLVQMAQVFDAPTTGDKDELLLAILDKIETNYCKTDTLRERIDRLQP